MATKSNIETLARMIEFYHREWRDYHDRVDDATDAGEYAKARVCQEIATVHNAQYNAAIFTVDMLGFSIIWGDDGKIVDIVERKEAE